MIEIKNLSAEIDGKEILKGLDLTVGNGEVHAIMGPNGAGKSTLSYVLSGRDGYEVTGGSAELDGEDILDIEPDERAAAGLFLAFQYPVEIPGVQMTTFLKTAINSVRKARGQEELDAIGFLKLMKTTCKKLGISDQMMKRAVNVGFSGGEKKRNEVLQMAMLEPKFAVLDETDSGLDIDALRIVADGVNALREQNRSFLVITHYQRLLDYIKPDKVHVLADGKIVKSGGAELALELEEKGYAEFVEEREEQYKDMLLWQAANDALKNGFILDVPKNTQVKNPLEVTHTGHAQCQTTARQIIRVEKDSEFTLIEYQIGAGEYWNNIVTQIDVAKGASFKHYRFQENSDEAVVTHNTHVVLEEGAHYEAFTLTSGANLSRNQVHVDMKGAHSTARLNGVNIMNASKLGDTTITVDHHAPNCQSFQDYRNVVDDKSTVVFQGKVHVHQPAQKTDGYQMAKSLLLSQQATVNTKPELEIYADDVKCSHGATTGRLDDEALFYLKSRGISQVNARNLLIQAFVTEVIDNISNENVREQASHIVTNWLDSDDNQTEDWL